jgi:hypothetical protein
VPQWFTCSALNPKEFAMRRETTFGARAAVSGLRKPLHGVSFLPMISIYGASSEGAMASRGDVEVKK